MILNEEIFEIDIPNVVHDDIEISNLETEIPQPGPEIGISNLITQLINSTYSMIEDYNSLSIALSDNQETEKAQIVSSMISNEHIHIGMLQSLLECFSPNADSIETGENIVDSVINESVNSTWVYAVYPKKINDTYEIWNILSDKGAHNKKFLTKEDCWNFIRKNAKYYNWQYAKRSDLKDKQLTDDTQQIIKFNESFPMNNGVDLEKVCRQIWKNLDGDVSDKEDWDNWLEVYWDDIVKLTNGESYTKMTVEGDNSKARLNLKTEGQHIVYKFFDEDEYYTAYDVQEIEDAIKRRNLNESVIYPKVRPNIIRVQDIYDYVVENGLEKEAKEILDDCKIKVIKGKCTEISANANPGNAYYRLSHLVDSKNESLNESSDHFSTWLVRKIGTGNVDELSDDEFDALCDEYNAEYSKYLQKKEYPKLPSGYWEPGAEEANTYWVNNESLNESMTEEQFNELIETLVKPLVADLDRFQDENGDDFSITWSFGANQFADKITAGLDIRFNPRFRNEETKDFDEETIKPFLTELEEIIDRNGFELDNVNGYDYKTQGPKTGLFTQARHYQIIEK